MLAQDYSGSTDVAEDFVLETGGKCDKGFELSNSAFNQNLLSWTSPTQDSGGDFQKLENEEVHSTTALNRLKKHLNYCSIFTEIILSPLRIALTTSIS